jgi:hypothetical protein
MGTGGGLRGVGSFLEERGELTAGAAILLDELGEVELRRSILERKRGRKR